MIDWQDHKPTNKPPLHISVLVRTIGAGPVYDVACYIGKNASGDERWIMADISLDPDKITHWAIINEPIERKMVYGDIYS